MKNCYYQMMARRVLSAVAVAVGPVVDLVAVVAGKEHQKQKAFRKLMLEPPVLDYSRRQKWMQEQIRQEQVDRTKVDRTLNLQLGWF